MKRNIVDVVVAARESGQLTRYENYWAYINTKTHDITVSDIENKCEGHVGYFVIDDAHLPGVAHCMDAKMRRVHV